MFIELQDVTVSQGSKRTDPLTFVNEGDLVTVAVSRIIEVSPYSTHGEAPNRKDFSNVV